jgi:ABC-type transport system involved in multi-copper enzyme maturation permease subunit
MQVTRGRLLRDVGLIAGFDLRESLRTRRALVLVLLYLLIAASASGIYVRIVSELEQGVAALPDVSGDPEAAAAMAMVQDQGYHLVLLFFAGGDAELANHLATYPAMVLIFAWISLAFLPWFIALTSYDQIAGDLHLRTIRYAALRTTRGAYVLGKLLGQAALVAGVAGLGMLPVVVIGALYLPGFDIARHPLALLSTWPITVVCALGFLGVVALASQLCRTPAPRGPPRSACCSLVWILSSYQSGDGLARRCSRPGTGSPACSTPRSASACSPSAACLGLCAGYTASATSAFVGATCDR